MRSRVPYPSRLARLRRWFLFVTCVAALSSAHADVTIPGYSDNFMVLDPREVSMLPGFCVYTEYFRQRYGKETAPELAQWRSLIGASFIHIHHYCFALIKTNRALLLARDKESRRWYLYDSLGEFDYVIDRVPETFVLLPEILTKKAENMLHLGMTDAAISLLKRASELKPDYWPPYARLGDYYKQIGDIDAARAALEKGLSLVPDAAALKRRLADLNNNTSAKRRAP